MNASPDLMRARARALQTERQWGKIRVEDRKAVVRIYDEIGYYGVTAAEFAAQIAALDVDEIEVQINSGGGDAFDSFAIYNALRLHPARVTTRVDGLAASGASVIVQAGDHRVMVKSAQMMIHEAWGLAVGPAAVMREFADLLEQQNEIMAGIYADRSGEAGGDVDHFKALMSATTWMTDQEAVDEGLADELLVPERPAPAAQMDHPPQTSAAAPPAADAGGHTFDPDRLRLLREPKVREMFGSSALAGNTPPSQEDN